MCVRQPPSPTIQGYGGGGLANETRKNIITDGQLVTGPRIQKCCPAPPTRGSTPGGSGFESRRRPSPAPLDGARSTRRVPGGRTPKYPLRPWVHTRGGNHQSVPGRKVEVGGSYARPTPRTYVGGTICRGGDRRHLWLTTIKKKICALRVLASKKIVY